MTSITEIALGDVESELATTRRFLEMIPDDRLDWKPHAKSNALGRLAMHIIELVKLQGLILSVDDGFDILAPTAGPPRRRLISSRADALETFDHSVARLRTAVGAATDQSLGVPWTLRLGDRVMGTGTRAAVLRRNGISHLIHHRAQLGLYYRLLDIPVPDAYGPTADTK